MLSGRLLWRELSVSVLTQPRNRKGRPAEPNDPPKNPRSVTRTASEPDDPEVSAASGTSQASCDVNGESCLAAGLEGGP